KRHSHDLTILHLYTKGSSVLGCTGKEQNGDNKRRSSEVSDVRLDQEVLKQCSCT
ncbi:hypothetical protein NDU88_001338, partial [Pleurodeles waltl]